MLDFQKYYGISKTAFDDRKRTKQEKSELEQVAEIRMKMRYEDKEEQEVYKNNFLIPNNKEFIELYKRNGKNVRAIAKELELSEKVIFSKATEIAKYIEYIKKINYSKKNIKEDTLEDVKGKNVHLLEENKNLLMLLEQKDSEIVNLKKKLADLENSEKTRWFYVKKRCYRFFR